MTPGDDIIVDWQGAEHHAEFVRDIGSGFIEALIDPDPILDYGTIGDHFQNVTTFIRGAVRSTHVRKAEK